MFFIRFVATKKRISMYGVQTMFIQFIYKSLFWSLNSVLLALIGVYCSGIGLSRGYQFYQPTRPIREHHVMFSVYTTIQIWYQEIALKTCKINETLGAYPCISVKVYHSLQQVFLYPRHVGWGKFVNRIWEIPWVYPRTAPNNPRHTVKKGDLNHP